MLIFGHEIIKCKVPENLYKNPQLNEDLNGYINYRENDVFYKKCNELEGDGFTTSSENKNNLFSLKNIDPLLNYISLQILENYFKGEFKNKNVLFLRAWVNKIYLNSSGRCHTHDSELQNSGTAIFYFKVPKNGSKLIILKEDIGNQIVKDEHKNISHYVEVESGDLIIHSPHVPHAVSKHMSEEPRICLVLDFFVGSKKLSYN